MGSQVKIRFNLSDGSFGGETLWAEQVSENRFCLLNIPFYAYGYAESDVVHCNVQDGWFVVKDIVEHSGNGTLRIMFADSGTMGAEQVLKELVSVGCSYERASSKLVAVTVPPSLQIPFSQLANYLNDYSEIVVGWEIAKPFTRNEK